MPPEDQAVHPFQADRQSLVLPCLQEVRPSPLTLGSPLTQGCQVHLANLLTLVDLVVLGYPALLLALVSLKNPFPLSLPSVQSDQLVLEILCLLLALWDQEDLKNKTKCTIVNLELKHIFFQRIVVH